ncbi:hypothetical protein [Fibrobacter sp. UWEL]|uniref:hypothetical protein n=1 Tax=Fibrobacter sp. UWEL TaxID=1896209 RepID=UPI000912B921|nr:hypothetical protein [Fibrobacter sp. UWEL]SHL41199.1 hypothetical protein SAMN05720468_12711 [Fibrobacter sp. UWEL]
MKFSRILTLAILSLLSVNAFALDRIWDMRYTYGPDSKPSPKFAAGLGLRTDFSDNIVIPVNLMGTLAKEWDMGVKVDVYAYNKLENVVASVDFGGRYRYKPGSYIELDGYFGLNRNDKSALVFTYGMEHYIAKNFSNAYEFRSGFLDGATGEDGIAKLVVGMTPTLHFGRSVVCMIEITSSGSIGNVREDFMLDIIPKLEVSVGGARVRLDFDIGILQENNNNQKGVGLYVLMGL